MDEISARVAKLRTLSQRELQVLQLMCDGRLGQEIAKQLFIAGSTVLFHRGHIYEKLGLAELQQGAPRQRELHLFCAALGSLSSDDVPPQLGPETAHTRPSLVALAAVENDEKDLARERYAREGVIPWTEPIPVPPQSSELDRTTVPRRARRNPLILIVAVALVAGLLGAGVMALLLGGRGNVGSSTPPSTAQQSIPTAIPTTAILPSPTAVSVASVVPTSRPQTPSPTSPPPTSTAQPDTVAGSVLDVGQTWRGGGMQLTLTRGDVTASGLNLHFSLINNKPQQINLSFDLFQVVSVVDNRNSRFQLSSSGPGSDCSGNYSFVLKPGEKKELPENDPCTNLVARGDVGNPVVTAITIRVSGISSIDNAVWRVPVFH